MQKGTDFTYQLYSSIGDESERKKAFEWRITSQEDEAFEGLSKTIRDDLNVLIEKGQTTESMIQLLDLIPESNQKLHGEIGAQYEKLLSLESDYQKDVISRSEYNVQSNRLAFWLINLINQELYDPSAHFEQGALTHEKSVVVEAIRKRVAEAKTYEALDYLKQYLNAEDPNQFVTAILLITRYQRAVRDNNRGLLDYEQFQVEVNQINHSLLKSLDELPDMGGYVKEITAVEEKIEQTDQPDAWIYIKGTTDKGRYENNRMLESIADEFGRKLADTNLGLIIGSWRGVNAAAFYAYIRARKLKRKQVKGFAKMLADTDIKQMHSGTSTWSDELVEDEVYMPGDVLEFADACVAIGHTGPLKDILMNFRNRQKPVLPILNSFGEGMLKQEFESFYLKLNELDLPQLEGHYKDSIDRIIRYLKNYDWNIQSEINMDSNIEIDQNDAKSSPDPNSKEPYTINCRPDFSADTVAIADMLNQASRNNSAIEAKIEWAAQIHVAIEECEKVYEEARNYLNEDSIFYNQDVKKIESLVTMIPGAIDTAKQIMERAHERIPKLIKGMSFERQSMTGCKQSIANFISHSNLYVLRTLLYPLTLDLLESTNHHFSNICPEFDENWFNEKDFYCQIYGFDSAEIVETVSLFSLPDDSGNALANVKYGLTVTGPQECLDNKNHDYNFYDHVFVPQIEFQMITRGDEVVKYDQSRQIYIKENRTTLH